MASPKTYSHILFILVFLLVYKLNICYKQPIQDYFSKVVLNVEAKASPRALLIFQILSIFSEGQMYLVLFVILTNWSQRAKAFLYIMLIGSAYQLVLLEKLIFTPEASITTSQETSMNCVLASASVFFFFFEDLEKMYNKVKIPKIYFLISALIIIFVCGFSRVFVGLDSINQVVQGCSLGIWLACYQHYCWSEDVTSHIHYVVENEEWGTPLSFQKKFFVSTSLHLTLILGNTFFYAFQTGQSMAKLQLKLQYGYPCLEINGFIGMIYGSYLGMLAYQHFFGDFYYEVLKTNAQQFIFRYIILVLCMLPFQMLSRLPFIANLWMNIFVKTMLPSVGITFNLFFIAPCLFRKIGLLDSEAEDSVEPDDRLKAE